MHRDRLRFHGKIQYIGNVYKIDLERKRSISEEKAMLTEQMFKGLNSFRLL